MKCKLLRTVFLPLALSIPAFLMGCSQTPYFEAVQPSNSIRSVLYIYRPEANNPGIQPLRFSYPDILINDTSIGVLHFNSHRYLELTPGSHTIRITGLSKAANWTPKDIAQAFTIEPGEIKYLKLDVQYNLKEMNLGENSPSYSIYVTPVEADDAIYEIRYTKPEY